MGEVNSEESFDYIKPGKTIHETLAKMFFYSLDKGDENEHTRSSETVDEDIYVDSICYNGLPVLYVANRVNKEGYVVMSADKGEYPIVAFSYEDSFKYDSLSPENKAYYATEVEARYLKMISDETTSVDPLWKELTLYQYQTDSDTVYVVSVDFFADLETKGSIPERSYPKNYLTKNQLLYNRGRQWTLYSPYNYNMPKPAYGSHTMPGIVLSLSLIMDYYRIPNAQFWTRQPSIQTSNKSTELTQFFRNLYNDLGGDKINNYVAAKNLYDKIPNVLYDKYGFKLTEPYHYFSDQVGFDKIRSHLYNNGLAIYTGACNTKYEIPVHTCVIDGVAELYTKVTVRKYFLGILIKKTVSYYYKDYLHFVLPTDRKSNLWGKYDWRGDTYPDNNIVLLLQKK